MRRLLRILTITVCLFSIFAEGPPVFANDRWVSVRSKNFLMVGNASEKKIRQVGVKLEQFREIFPRLFPKLNFNSPVPTTVVVFKDDTSYKPFKPTASTAGYFQPGPDVNYIALTSEIQREENPYNVIFHEYTHLLMNNHTKNLPLWLDEGLAEYYSTYSITDDQKIVLGRPIASHVFLLRQNKMLPLRTLFAVDHKSPHYNERNKQNIFYAESWALLHYLILGNNGQRAGQIGKFIELMAANTPMEDAFQQAYGMTFESMERDLSNYFQNDRYALQVGKFQNKINFDTQMQVTEISEAKAQAYLGDLLLHSSRAESETYLQRALALDPDLPMANASLGMLRVRQGKAGEARVNLERAVAADSQNYLIHYYYAYALSREGQADMQSVTSYSPDTAAKIRAEVRKSIELRPDFAEAHGLLAFVNLVTETDLDETAKALQRVMVTSPNNASLQFVLAQIYLRQEDFQTGRQILESLANSTDPQIREQVKSLLIQSVAREEEMKRIHELEEELAAAERRLGPTAKRLDAGGVIEYRENADPSFILRGTLRKPAAGETQVDGMLVRIDCEPNGFVFVVKVGDGLLRLRTDSFNRIEMRTFASDVRGEVTCGHRNSERVVVCYLPSSASKTAGLLKSLEFVPKDFKLKPAD